MNGHLTVVGGGLGGLVSAIAGREAGFEVTLYEARRELGGRARTTAAAYRANWGPHVIYGDGPMWTWLDKRGLAEPAGRAPTIPRMRYRVRGRARSIPPARVARGVIRLRRLQAPVEASFFDWASDRLGDPDTARRISNLMGVATFDHDPGRFSAAFVNEHLRRATVLPPTVRYIPGGWATLIDRLALHAHHLGVSIETASPINHLPSPPVILAVPLKRAATLLGDPELTWTGTTTALLDLGVQRRRGDPYILTDLDASGWVETFSIPDPSLAPPGENLIQAQAGLRPGENLDQAVERLEGLIDAAFGDWRERETWRRRLQVIDESGALDPPGATWRDRPKGDRGDGVHIVGDMVAAPGFLSEVAFRSALDAIDGLVRRPEVTSVPIPLRIAEAGSGRIGLR